MLTFFGKIRRRWQDRRAARRFGQIDAGERGQMARELGVGASALAGAIATASAHSGLMPAMMQARDLDAEAIHARHPAVLRDMEVVCAQCQASARCKSELAAGTAAANAAQFCPNATTMDALH